LLHHALPLPGAAHKPKLFAIFETAQPLLAKRAPARKRIKLTRCPAEYTHGFKCCFGGFVVSKHTDAPRAVENASAASRGDTRRPWWEAESFCLVINGECWFM
jgi:hypothetical protein